MSDALRDQFQTCLGILTGDQHPRVWSLIVTVFGDLAQDPGSRISGAVLSRITELAGIKPEAMRVALHRLRKDGWIESERVGRASRHHLTEFGREQSARVSPRIYGEAVMAPDLWHVLISNGAGHAREVLEEFLLTGSYISVGSDIALAPGPMPEQCDDLLVFETTDLSVPDWLTKMICPDPLNVAYHDLHERLASFETCLERSASLSVFEVAATRTLIVHNWRRLLLRHPELPGRFFPKDWPGQKCRALVFRILTDLPRPSLDLLETEA